MKRLLLALFAFLCFPVFAHAQVYPAPPNVGLAAALPHTCTMGAPLNPTQPQWYFATDTSTLYVCISNTASYPSNWGSVSGGGGGSGCVPAGSAGQILSDSGSGGCNDSTLTDNGTDVTGSEPLFLGTDNSTAGTIRLSNSAANAHTILQSGATTTNTIKGFTVVPTTGDLVDCSSATTVCTLTDAGVLAADILTYHTPATGIARTTSASQAVVSTELSGDATTSGSNAVTVVRINGTSLAGLATGLLKNTTSTGVPSIAASSDVIALWTGTCNNTTFLRADGACAAGGGSGTVNTGTMPDFAYYATSTTAVSDSGIPATAAGILAACTGCAPLVSPSFTTPVLGAATGTSVIVTGRIDGTSNVNVTTTTACTLGTAGSNCGAESFSQGWTYNQEGTAATGVTYTLPATSLGLSYCTQNSIVSGTGAPDTGVLTVYPPSNSYVILNGVRNTIGGGGTHGVASGGAAADAACFIAIDATDWNVIPLFGAWAAN